MYLYFVLWKFRRSYLSSSRQRKKAITCITEKLHADDTTKGLEYLDNWLIGIAQTENNEIKKDILIKTFETLLTFCKITSGHNTTITISTSTNEEKISLNEPSSLFMIKILLKELLKKRKKRTLMILSNLDVNSNKNYGIHD